MKTWIPLTQRAGIGLAFAAAIISGFAVYINGFAVKQAPGALSFTTAKNIVAAVIITAVLLATSARGQIKPSLSGLGTKQWLALAYVGVISGGVAFSLFFQGLAQANTTEAAFVQKSLVIWVAFMAVPFLHEKLGLGSLVAIALLLIGQVLLILGAAPGKPGTVSALILVFAATLLWAVEIVILRKLLTSIPTPLIGSIRMGIGAVVLIVWLAVTGGIGQLGAMGSVWGWALLTGVILSGYVLTWFGALRRAQAIDVTAVLVVGAFVTALLSMPSASAISVLQIAGLILIAGGAAVLIRVKAWRTRPAEV